MNAYRSFFGEELFKLVALHVVLGEVLQEGEERASRNGVDIDVASEYFAERRYRWYMVREVLVYIKFAG